MGLVCVLLALPAEAAEIGIASTFYDKRVACPPYRINPYKVIGIAHKTLACGTRVEISNHSNGRKTVATVLDRGPCSTAHCQKTAPVRIKKRKFDLLPLVARSIGSSGLVMVSLRVLP